MRPVPHSDAPPDPKIPTQWTLEDEPDDNSDKPACDEELYDHEDHEVLVYTPSAAFTTTGIVADRIEHSCTITVLLTASGSCNVLLGEEYGKVIDDDL
ncbi:Protein of unknown function [Gryllus bimaculatus]|nr:Protein of unknown function [Gryllus bimaculatus]